MGKGIENKDCATITRKGLTLTWGQEQRINFSNSEKCK